MILSGFHRGTEGIFVVHIGHTSGIIIWHTKILQFIGSGRLEYLTIRRNGNDTVKIRTVPFEHDILIQKPGQ